uniref:Uncharacterized protein n=1 Tax=Aegilops tauschii subsp. strangulata TaxID=200361 RepID=A0A453FEH3_AEGTS
MGRNFNSFFSKTSQRVVFVVPNLPFQLPSCKFTLFFLEHQVAKLSQDPVFKV